MSRFVESGTGLTIETPARVTLENKIAKLVRKLEPENGIEYLTGALASICSTDQLHAFVMELEKREGKQ
jgi:hypothetical protein